MQPPHIGFVSSHFVDEMHGQRGVVSVSLFCVDNAPSYAVCGMPDIPSMSAESLFSSVFRELAYTYSICGD